MSVAPWGTKSGRVAYLLAEDGPAASVVWGAHDEFLARRAIRFASFAEEPGIYGDRGVDACVGDWGEYGAIFCGERRFAQSTTVSRPGAVGGGVFELRFVRMGSISYPNFEDWRRDNHSFSALGAFRTEEYNLTGAGEPERLHGHMVSADFLSALGINTILGRNILGEEDQAGGAPVVVLGDGLWRRKFGLSQDVLGKSLTLNGKQYTVVGVATSRITGLSPTDVYLPIGQWTDTSFRDRHIGMGTNAIGRLKPGVTFEQAKADMDSVAKNLAAAYPDSNKGSGIAMVPLKTDVVGSVRGILLVLLGAVSFVLLIACANVANLLLARSTGRSREFAIRSALGASPGRVIRQLLTESVMLGIVGGGIGLLLAKWGTRAILAALPETLPRTEEIGIDGHVLFFTLGISVLTGIVFGLVPALKTMRPDMHETLKEGGRGSSGARHRTQSVFVAVEMAMAVVLLIGAGLMIRSLAALWNVNPGFDPRNV